MANTTDQTKGYLCEFIDSVPDDFFCKKCNLVARKLTVCNSCMENYCYSCITDTQKQGQPCPTCGVECFKALPHSKYQKRMKELQVYCNLKERGCGWSGSLEQLDTHLDPDQDNCQYMDVSCPLGCKQIVSKNNIVQHVSEECVKRDYFCQYCSFKATYEEVVDKHLPKCVYVPLQCPNLCGVTFERDFLEDHMKICRLEEIECEFSGVGCEERIRREDLVEHTTKNSDKHLILTAFLAKQLQQKLEEQEKKHKEEETMMRKKIKEQEKKIEEQEKKLEEQEKKMKELKEEHEHKLKEQILLLEQKLISNFQEIKEVLKETKVKSDQNEANHDSLVRLLDMQQRRFEIKNYATEIKKGWLSPAMYTHTYGYKFCILVYINLYKHVCVRIQSMPGEFDSQLNWPAIVKFTIELIHQQGGENVVHTTDTMSWKKPACVTFAGVSHALLMSESRLHEFDVHETLYFYVSNIQIL